MTQKELQQRELFAGQGDTRSAAGHFTAHQVDEQIRRLKLAFNHGRCAAAQQSSDSRQQLGKGKGLHQIVVRAQLQSLDPMLNGAQSRQQQDGHPFIGGAQHSDNIPAIHIGQHNIENQQVIIAGHRQVIAVQTIIGQVDDKTGLR